MLELEAVRLTSSWAVRPKGQLGTHGWVNGKAWNVQYIKAATAEQAIRKATK